MLNFCWVSTFFDILFFNICKLLISRTPIKDTIFWKSMMRSFRWIEINCFNRFRFLAEVSTNLQKMHYFGQLKKEKRKLDKWPHFFHLLFEVCWWYSFLYLKIVKIYFHAVLLSSILVCKISEFWRCKLWDQKFFLFDSGNIHIKESKKLGFTFSIELRTKFVWSPGLLLSVPECYFA